MIAAVPESEDPTEADRVPERHSKGPRLHQDPVPAIVIGLDSPTGLQTARILAARGIPVVGLAARPNHPCCRTRACTWVVEADTSGPGLIDSLLQLDRELARGAVLIPCTDMSVLMLSRHRTRIPDRLRLALPDEETIETLLDKELFYRFAQREGLPIPRTSFLASREDALAAADALRFPVVLKPAVKTPAWESSARKAYRVESPGEMLDLYDRCSEWSDRLIVQEWIAGGDTDHYTCNAYFDAASRPLVTFTTRKLRQWPAFGGEASLSEEYEDQAVVEETVRVFSRAGHRGLGYLELKRDARTGDLLIIEPNVGRPTGRSATAEAAGVDLLHTVYCDLLGLPLPESRVQTFQGVKWIHRRRDLQAALYQWWHGKLTVRQWLASLRGPKTSAVLSWRDPVPFIADLARVSLKLWRSTGRRRVR